MEKLRLWLREHRALAGVALTVLGALVAGLAYCLDPDREPPPGAAGTGYPCIMGCVPPCFGLTDTEAEEPDTGNTLTCLFKCVIWCVAEPGEATVSMVEGTGEGAADVVVVVVEEGTEAGTGEGSR